MKRIPRFDFFTKATLTVIAACLVWIVARDFGQSSAAFGQAASQPVGRGKKRVIEAEEFVLIDEGGHKRAVIGERARVAHSNSYGDKIVEFPETRHVGLVILDEQGRRRIELGSPIRESTGKRLQFVPYIRLSDSDGTAAAQLIAPRSRSELNLKSGTSDVSLSARGDCTVLGPACQSLEFSEGTDAQYSLPRTRICLRNKGDEPSCVLRDEKGNVRAVLGTTHLEKTKSGATETTSPASLVLFDKEGKVMWQTP